MDRIANIIPILSGKGGVGKSSVTVQLALTLSLQGYSVGVLDIDLTGPSIPRLFGIEEAKIRQAPGGWLPVEVHSRFKAAAVISDDQLETGGNGTKINDYTVSVKEVGPLHCMSLGFLLRDRGDAVVWRGPKKTAMIGQLLKEVLWPVGMQYLLIDTPPGTSDEHIALATSLLDPNKVSSTGRIGAVVVTTPQAISTADVRKELSFCQKTGLKVFGVIENMAGYVCECCGEKTDVFSRGGGQVMASEWGVPFLGSLPIDAVGWSMLVEEGKRPVYGPKDDTRSETEEVPSRDEKMVERYTSCSLYRLFNPLVKGLVAADPSPVERPSDTA